MAKNEARGSLAFMSKSPRHFPGLLSSVDRDRGRGREELEGEGGVVAPRLL